jgi:GntR family transcriptional regulator, transcriptional repressor for pyruvate dehydrogenase complex
MAKQKVTNHETQVTKQVVSHIRRMIENGTLQAGDKIPPEREFAHNLKISRASLRTGIGYLAAMGVLKIRHGVGTFVSDGPPDLGHASLSLLGALHGFKLWQLFEARLILERNLASLAAERGLDENFAALAEEVAEMYATVDDPAAYLIHDVRFHRAIAEAAGNPILAAVMETIASSLYEQRRTTVERAQNLKESAKEHRDIYRAIRSRNAAEAHHAMELHLKTAQAVQEMEQASTREKTRKPRQGAPVRNNSRHESRIGLYAPKRVKQ